jgi:hypothetical protein
MAELKYLNFWYWFGAILALFYGINHLSRPHSIAKAWGLPGWQHAETIDFVRLLGVWIFFQSIVATVIAKDLKDLKVRYSMTAAHVLKNLFAFLLRCQMWKSGRYPITTGFMMSTGADLLFVFGYGYFLVFPEKEAKKQ